MKVLLRVVAVFSLLLLSACRSSTPGPDANPIDSGSRGERILATGYVIRLDNGVIVLDSPTAPRRNGPLLQTSKEFTRYELTPSGEVAKMLDARLAREEVTER